jgi:hypothetical protein
LRWLQALLSSPTGSHTAMGPTPTVADALRDPAYRSDKRVVAAQATR